MPGGFNLVALIALASDAIAERIIAWGHDPFALPFDDERPAQLLAGDLAPVDFVEVGTPGQNHWRRGVAAEHGRASLTQREAIARSHKGGL